MKNFHEFSIKVRAFLGGVEIPFYAIGVSVGVGGVNGNITIPSAKVFDDVRMMRLIGGCPISIYIMDSRLGTNKFELFAEGVVVAVRTSYHNGRRALLLAFKDQLIGINKVVYYFWNLHEIQVNGEQSNMVTESELTILGDQIAVDKLISSGIVQFVHRLCSNCAINDSPIVISRNIDLKSLFDTLKREDSRHSNSPHDRARLWIKRFSKISNIFDTKSYLDAYNLNFVRRYLQMDELLSLLHAAQGSTSYQTAYQILHRLGQILGIQMSAIPYPIYTKNGIKSFAVTNQTIKNVIPDDNMVASVSIGTYIRSVDYYNDPTHAVYLTSPLMPMATSKLEQFHAINLKGESIRSLLSGPVVRNIGYDPIASLTLTNELGTASESLLREKTEWMTATVDQIRIERGTVLRLIPGMPILLDLPPNQDMGFGLLTNVTLQYNAASNTPPQMYPTALGFIPESEMDDYSPILKSDINRISNALYSAGLIKKKNASLKARKQNIIKQVKKARDFSYIPASNGATYVDLRESREFGNIVEISRTIENFEKSFLGSVYRALGHIIVNSIKESYEELFDI